MTEFDPMSLLKYYKHQIGVIKEESKIGKQITKLEKQINFERKSNYGQQENELEKLSAHIFEIDTLEWEFDSDFLA